MVDISEKVGEVGMKDDNGMSAFGVWLKCMLIEAGMNQRDLAKLIGTTEVSVSRWIHGKRIPKQSQVCWILDYFNCHIEIVPNEKSTEWAVKWG